MRRTLLGGAFLAMIFAGQSASLAQELDPASGLVIAPELELVRANCTACHSAKLVTQMRGDRAAWLSLIRWMQETQNLWLLPPSVEDTILDYLSTYYGQSEGRARRPPLAPGLMPPLEDPQ